jgi:mono/diheme cytochrome c family protein
MSKRSVLGFAILMVALLLLVTLVVASCGGEDETTTTAAAVTTTASPPETSEPDIDAAALYAENCAGCHADGVRGSASEIETTVTDGSGDMPSFADKLSAEEVAALAAYAAGGGN